MDVRLPDGTVVKNVPEGTTKAQLMARVGRAQPQPKKEAETSELLGFAKGALKPIDNAAAWIENGLDAIGVDTKAVADFFGTPTAHEANRGRKEYFQEKERQGVKPGFAGEVVGNIATTLPLTISNPWLSGAASGALTAEDPDSLNSVGASTALGAVAGKAGDVLARGAGNLISATGKRGQEVLKRAGVTMTPGQMVGGTVKRIEDTLTSVPIVGNVIKNAQGRSIDDFNRAAVNRTLKPIGIALPDNVKTGHEAIRFAGDKLDEAYETLLPKITVRLDKEFTSNIDELADLATNLPEARAKQFATILDREIKQKFTGVGAMSGRTMKDIESKIGKLVREYKGSSDADQRLLGSALQEVQDQLRSLVSRSNPDSAAELKAINRGWANLVRIEDAAARQGANKSGVFSPAQLSGAVRNKDSSVRKRAVARGQAMMQDLSGAGQSVLPSIVPDSGTAGRLMLPGLMAGGAVAADQGLIDPKQAALAALLLAPYSKMGSRMLSPMMVGRTNASPAAKVVAEQLMKYGVPAAAPTAAVLGSQAIAPR